jgi:peptidoglycan hydrolase-like protein with peptidoglycan-binding domain
VLSARNVPRVDHVNFAVHTGAIIPRSVNIVAISTFPVLIETFPQYRDYSFFVVEDEIVFVDRGHKVVDVVPVGPRTRFSRASSSTAVAVNLSEPEIREVQLVLVQRGFLHGRVTGVWGPETHEALIAFQRKEGFSATGSIDTRTVGALGLSGKVKAQESSSTQGSSSTTTAGQGQSGQPNTSGQAPAQNNATGQTGTQNPSDKQSSSGQTNPPSTTGQGTGNPPSSSGSSMNSGSSSSIPAQSGSSSSTSGTSGQSNMPEKTKN